MLLEVAELTVTHAPDDGDATVLVDDVSVGVEEGEVTAVVGASGSGKTLTALSILDCLPRRMSWTGDVRIAGAASRCGAGTPAGVAMIFQEPTTSLNPTWPVGTQIADVVRRHAGGGRDAARKEAVRLMQRVGIEGASARAGDAPHRFSGGQLQRLVTALALATQPRLLLADEPTSALDATTGLAILDLLRSLREQEGLGVLLVTHDFRIVAREAQRVVVMKDGRVVESGEAASLMRAPEHAWTRALLDAAPARPGS